MTFHIVWLLYILGFEFFALILSRIVYSRTEGLESIIYGYYTFVISNLLLATCLVVWFLFHHFNIKIEF